MYARETDVGKFVFSVESDKGYAEIILQNGLIEQAYLGENQNDKKDLMHRAYFALKLMAETSLPCYVEMFEMLDKKSKYYEDAKHLLKVQNNFHKIELLQKQKFQEKIEKLLQNA